jgi:DNA-binding LacI/PurR family transcriptional regulator/DNA-binding transcriptional regulator YhcF (GntR family)
MPSTLRLNPATRSKPPYQRVLEAVAEGIALGTYKPGDRLPSLKAMGKQLGVHFLTVRKAMLELSRRGVVEMHVGVGTFVLSRPEAPTSAGRKVLRLAAVYSDLLMRHMRGSHPGPSLWIDGLNRRNDTAASVVQVHCYRDGCFVEDLGRILLDSSVDGIIQFGATGYKHSYRFCKEHGIPLAECSTFQDPHDWALVVRPNMAEAMRQAMDYLRSLGHRRIAYVGYQRVPRSEVSRELFIQLAGREQSDLTPSVVTLDNRSGVVTWADADRFFTIEPRPTAVIAQDEFVADRLLYGCLKRGVDIPGQLSLLAIQDLWPQRTGIDLTTLFTYETIRGGISLATDLLMKRIAGEAVAPQHSLTPQMMIGDSTAPCVQSRNRPDPFGVIP